MEPVTGFIIGVLILLVLIAVYIGIGVAGNHFADIQCQNKCKEQADREYGHPTSPYRKFLKENSKGKCNFLCWIS